MFRLNQRVREITYQVLFLSPLPFDVIGQVSCLHHNLLSLLGDFGDATSVHDVRNKRLCDLPNQLGRDHQSTQVLQR